LIDPAIHHIQLYSPPVTTDLGMQNQASWRKFLLRFRIYVGVIAGDLLQALTLTDYQQAIDTFTKNIRSQAFGSQITPNTWLHNARTHFNLIHLDRHSLAIKQARTREMHCANRLEMLRVQPTEISSFVINVKEQPHPSARIPACKRAHQL
jgi:hypothetical protein